MYMLCIYAYQHFVVQYSPPEAIIHKSTASVSTGVTPTVGYHVYTGPMNPGMGGEFFNK